MTSKFKAAARSTLCLSLPRAPQEIEITRW
jgi:hypothetical protein